MQRCTAGPADIQADLQSQAEDHVKHQPGVIMHCARWLPAGADWERKPARAIISEKT